jgi:hypothetical protein
MPVTRFVGDPAFTRIPDRLRETFTAGAVASASAVKGRAGQSRGVGVVEMGTIEEAQERIGPWPASQLDGSCLSVEFPENKASSGGWR